MLRVSAALVLMGSCLSSAAFEFPDPGLERAVRQAAGVPEPQPLTSADVDAIRFLDASYSQITDLTGLPALKLLDSLFLYGNEQLQDIAVLAEIPTLYKLFAFGCDVSDISPLSNLILLHELRLELNEVESVAPLAGLVNLRLLALSSNNVADIGPLAGLTRLRELLLSGNNIASIDALAGMNELVILDASNNTIDSVYALRNLPALTTIKLDNNLIEDVGPLAANPGLGLGDELDIRRNPLNDASYEVYIPQLQARGVTVRFDDRRLPGDFSLRSEVVAAGFNRPLCVASPPGDSSRLVILEQVAGLLRLVKNGALVEAPFLDLGSKIEVSGNEQGLLSMAFHPNYAENGYFYVSYTGAGGASMVERYHVSDNPDVADPASAATVVGPVAQPFSDHNGGMLAFGPDGYLYLSLGDGGGNGDPGNRAQNLDLPYGKILRMDVDNGLPAAAPLDNPFQDRGGISRFIWAYGFRNPWRFSFDRLTGDLYIGDVGQSTMEEISFQPASSTGGENYGWKLIEGTAAFACPPPLTEQACDIIRSESVPPLYAYNHDEGQAVTGGYVYRGSEIPSLAGYYLFGDFAAGRVWTFRYDGINVTDFRERTAELSPPGETWPGNVASFGEDASGELYMVDFSGGRILRIRNRLSADINGDGATNAIDVQLVVNAVLGVPIGYLSADANHDKSTDAIDVQTVVNSVLEAG